MKTRQFESTVTYLLDLLAVFVLFILVRHLADLHPNLELTEEINWNFDSRLGRCRDDDLRLR
jgi:hypothetical protein